MEEGGGREGGDICVWKEKQLQNYVKKCIISRGNGRRSLSSKERSEMMYFSSVGLEDKGQTCL